MNKRHEINVILIYIVIQEIPYNDENLFLELEIFFVCY